MKILQMLVGEMSVFAYLIGCEKTGEAVVIDPAGDEDKIKEKADNNGFSIVKIINTHGHPDHTCGNFRMKELTNALILAHQEDSKAMISSQAKEFARMLGCVETPPPDEILIDGSFIKVGSEINLKVIHTPGHSPGSICLYTVGHIFTGDTLFVGGVGRTDLPGGSWQVMSTSINRHLLTLPDDTVVWPGHNYGISRKSTVKQERETNAFLR